VSRLKQKAKNNRQLLVASASAVVLAVGLVVLPVSATPFNANWNFFIRGTVIVLALSMLLHLFYFSWLSGVPMKRLSQGSAVPLKQLVVPMVALHLLLIIPVPGLSFWDWGHVGYGILGESSIVYLFPIFIVGEWMLLGSLYFAPVFSGLNVVWRIPVLLLGAGTIWCLGFIMIAAHLVGR